MPRRPIFTNKSLSLWERFKSLIIDKYTWFTLLYMLLMLPLGVIYFTVAITLVTASLHLIASPITELIFGIGLFTIDDIKYFIPAGLMPVAVIGGGLLLVLTLHLAKIFGRFHGLFAKTLLVRE